MKFTQKEKINDFAFKIMTSYHCLYFVQLTVSHCDRWYHVSLAGLPVLTDAA